MDAYLHLEHTFKKIHNLEGAKAVLHWDTSVMMPSGGQHARGEQLATLEEILHETITSPEVGDLLARAETEKSQLSPWQQANLREMQRQWRHANAVDSKLVTALTRTGSKCEMVWREARKNNDFASFAPVFKEVVALVREMAEVKAANFDCSLYDALLDHYDPGRKSAEIDTVFSDLETFLPSFIEEVLEHQASKPAIIPLQGPFPVEKQKELGLRCMRALSFNFDHGRLDVSAHPFCGGVPSDIRITTRYNTEEFITALMGIQHETGHALYEDNLPKAWVEQPVGKACGMSIHESQSLLIEMQACRSKEFLSFILPAIREVFGVSGKAWELENIHRITTKVERSLIRVDADEVTYPAHVMLRYKLEKALLSGDLEVDGLPVAWNELMQRYVGITPDSDRNGCMQDIHWTDGSFGYFPTYTFGALYAAQFFHAAKKHSPSVLNDISRGNFSTLQHWLKDHVYQYGMFYHAGDLVKHATGAPLDVGIYKQHLRDRYLAA